METIAGTARLSSSTRLFKPTVAASQRRNGSTWRPDLPRIAVDSSRECDRPTSDRAGRTLPTKFGPWLRRWPSMTRRRHAIIGHYPPGAASVMASTLDSWDKRLKHILQFSMAVAGLVGMIVRHVRRKSGKVSVPGPRGAPVRREGAASPRSPSALGEVVETPCDATPTVDRTSSGAFTPDALPQSPAIEIETPAHDSSGLSPRQPALQATPPISVPQEEATSSQAPTSVTPSHQTAQERPADAGPMGGSGAAAATGSPASDLSVTITYDPASPVPAGPSLRRGARRGRPGRKPEGREPAAKSDRERGEAGRRGLRLRRQRVVLRVPPQLPQSVHAQRPATGAGLSLPQGGARCLVAHRHIAAPNECPKETRGVGLPVGTSAS